MARWYPRRASARHGAACVVHRSRCASPATGPPDDEPRNPEAPEQPHPPRARAVAAGEVARVRRPPRSCRGSRPRTESSGGHRRRRTRSRARGRKGRCRRCRADRREELGAAFLEVTAGPPPAGCPPPVRVAGLRRHRHDLPAQAALSPRRPRTRRLPPMTFPAPPPPRRGRGPARPAVGAAARGRGRRRSSSASSRSARRGTSSASSSSTGSCRAEGAADDVAEREYAVLGHLEEARLPAVPPVGIAEPPGPRHAILVTEYLATRSSSGACWRASARPRRYRDRLLDAMALLLVDLHRGGVFWGDCSLANTLFRRDGDRIQAFLVDAETSEVHPELSDGQRAYDLEILVENVGFGLADVAASRAARTTSTTRSRPPRPSASATRRSGRELHLEPSCGRRPPRDPGRLRRLNELGFAVDLEIDPVRPAGVGAAAASRHDPPLPRPRARAPDAHPGARGPGAAAAERPARACRVARSTTAGRSTARGGRERWRREVYRPRSRGSPGSSAGPRPVQAYCDVLEHKWLLSERAERDVGLEAAIEAYLAEGAPAPERTGDGRRRLDSLDVEADDPTRATARAERRAAVGLSLSPTSARGGRPRPSGFGRRPRSGRSARPGPPGSRTTGCSRSAVLREAEQLARPRPARRPSPGSCRRRAPRPRASSRPRAADVPDERQRRAGARGSGVTSATAAAAPATWPAYGPTADEPARCVPVLDDDEVPALLVLRAVRRAGPRPGSGRGAPARAAGRRSGGPCASFGSASQTCHASLGGRLGVAARRRLVRPTATARRPRAAGGRGRASGSPPGSSSSVTRRRARGAAAAGTARGDARRLVRA